MGMYTMVWIDEIYSMLYHYITIDVIVFGGVAILIFLVCWNFWGKSWVMEQINEAGRKKDVRRS
jgi:hypothetical protein